MDDRSDPADGLQRSSASDRLDPRVPECPFMRGLLDSAHAVAGATIIERRADRQRFAAEPPPAAAVKPWDVAIAQITITDPRRRTADFTRPYMSVEQGVLAAQTV